MKRIIPLLLAAAFMLSMLTACNPSSSSDPTPPASSPPPVSTPPVSEPPAEPVYIPAPYTANSEDELTAKILDPVFYENEGGPTIGVTLVGVIQIGDQYFRDINNNQKLDDFEDWRLDAQTRAEAMAKALSDTQLTHQIVNQMAYSPKSTKVDDVVDESGNPVWTKLFPAGGGWGASEEGSNIEFLDTAFRSFVMRNNPAAEVAVWFNNGLEQYSEFDAIRKNEVAVPYTTFTNPIAHGMPGTLGVTAAALGDGNADLVLKDTQYDRVVMWAKGIDGIYGPQIDLVTDPRWSRNDGTYGERVDMAEQIARNLTIGYQNGDQGMVPGSVLLTVKHFPGDGAAYNGFESHAQAGRYRVYSTENSLANYQLKPFIAAFEAGAAGVMPGYSQPIVDARIAPQSITYNGKTVDIRFGGYGNAFNSDILQTLLRDTLGFKGLINSDSLNPGQYHGVEDMSVYDQLVLYVKSGVDCGCISVGTGNGSVFMEALTKGDLTRADLERAAANRLLPHAQNGNLDNPYRDLDESVASVNEVTPQVQALAAEAHLKSVVLMKNSDNTLPLKDAGKKIYIERLIGNLGNPAMAMYGMAGDSTDVTGITNELTALGYTVVDDYKQADIALLMIKPKGPQQSSNVLGVIDLVEDVDAPTYDDNAKPDGEDVNVTTVIDVKRIKLIADAIHANGGKVISTINITSPWILTNLEPYCDALMGTFSTSDTAVAQVLSGKYAPTGKLPVTMVADECVIELIETDIDGEVWEVCVSPNDVPGYDKEKYMQETENGRAALAKSPSGSYAYKDADGNLYWSGFGLTFTANPDGPTGGGTTTNPENPSTPSNPAGPSTPADPTATGLDFNSQVTALDGEWKLSQVVAGGETKAAVADALSLKITMEEDPSELVDGTAYIHNRVYNLTGILTFGLQSVKDALAAEDIDEYKGSTSWNDFPQGKVVEDGGWYEQPGPATMRFKDIDDYGLYLDQLAGVSADIDTTEKNLILGMNAAGQLLLGYSEAHLERPGTSGEWAYCLIFDKA